MEAKDYPEYPIKSSVVVEDLEKGIYLDAGIYRETELLQCLDLSLMSKSDDEPVLQISILQGKWYLLLTEVTHGHNHTTNFVGKGYNKILNSLQQCTLKDLKKINNFFLDSKTGKNKSELIDNLYPHLLRLISAMEDLYKKGCDDTEGIEKNHLLFEILNGTQGGK